MLHRFSPCEACGSTLLQELLETVEGAAPAAAMAVAAFHLLEHRLAKGDPRLSLLIRERHGHQGLMPGAAIVLVPGEGEDEPLGGYGFAQHATLPALLAVLVAAQAGPPGTTGP